MSISLENISDEIERKANNYKKVEASVTLSYKEIKESIKKYKILKKSFNECEIYLSIMGLGLAMSVPWLIVFYLSRNFSSLNISLGCIAVAVIAYFIEDKRLSKKFSKLSVNFFNEFKDNYELFNTITNNIYDIELFKKYTSAFKDFKNGEKENFTKKMIEIMIKMDFDKIEKREINIKSDIENKKEIELSFAKNKLVKLI